MILAAPSGAYRINHRRLEPLPTSMMMALLDEGVDPGQNLNNRWDRNGQDNQFGPMQNYPSALLMRRQPDLVRGQSAWRGGASLSNPSHRVALLHAVRLQ